MSAMACFGNICVKDLCLRVRDNHRKKLQAGNCAKECQLIRAKSRKVKDSSYKLLKKANHKSAKNSNIPSH